MIDWFASKLGIIVFVVVVSGILLYFAGIQNTIYLNAVVIQEVNDLAKVVDGLCDNCSTEYSFDDSRNVTIVDNLLSLDGVERTVVSEFVSDSIEKKEIVIKNVNGKIKIE